MHHPSKLAGLFTGYKASKEVVYDAAKRAGLNLHEDSPEEDDLKNWTSKQVNKHNRQE